MPGRLGLIAGGGDLPARLLAACRARDRDVFVVALEGQADPALVADGAAHAWARLGAAGRIISLLRDAQIDELVLAGKVERPSLGELRPDWRALRFLAGRGGRLGGDDDLLNAIIGAIEREEGIRVVAPDSLLAELPAPLGVLGRCRPLAEDHDDIAIALAVARQVGALDVGQAVVVQQGRILAVEAAEGTDALIERAGRLQRPGRGAILVKIRKPQQDGRADPPVIGPETVRRAAAGRLAGIAVEAGGTLIVDRAESIRCADESGIFLLSLDAG